MDPKMDPPTKAVKALDLPALVASGALPLTGGNDNVSPVKGASESDGGEKASSSSGSIIATNKPRALTVAQAKVLSLELLVREMAWCEGTSLAETVFTCLYLHPLIVPHLLTSFLSSSSNSNSISSSSQKDPISEAAAPEAAAAASSDVPSVGEEVSGGGASPSSSLGLRAFSAVAVGTVRFVALTREVVFHADIYEVVHVPFRLTS
jgi:hypothetical protein